MTNNVVDDIMIALTDSNGNVLRRDWDKECEVYMEKFMGVKPTAPTGESKEELARYFGASSSGKACQDLVNRKGIEEYRRLRILAVKEELL